MAYKDLLPEKFRNIQAWSDLADAMEEVIASDFIDTLERLRNLRDPRLADEDYISNIKRFLGFFVNLADFQDTPGETIRLIEQLPFFYSKSGTRFFVDFVGYVKNMLLEFTELYTFKNVDTDSIGTGDGSTVTFATTLANIPLFAGTVVVTDTVETFSDDGLGTLTGDMGGSGTINYKTGVISVTFNTAPTTGQDINAAYDTKAYQGFFPLSMVTGPFTADGGDWYLTNHVNVNYDLEVYPVDPSGLSNIFYQVASAVLVLNTLEGVVLAGPAVLYHTGEAHVHLEEWMSGAPSPTNRNILWQEDFIASILGTQSLIIGETPPSAIVIGTDEAATYVISLSEFLEVAYYPGPTRYIVHHKYTIGETPASAIIIGGAEAGKIDSISPAIDTASQIGYLEVDLREIATVTRFDLTTTPDSGYDLDTSEWLPVDPDYGYVVGDTELSSFVVSDFILERYHGGGAIDPGIVMTSNLSVSHFQDVLDYWATFYSGRKRLGVENRFERYGVDAADAIFEVEVSYRDTTGDAWSAWVPVTGATNIDTRYLRFRLYFECPTGKYANVFVDHTYGQMDVADQTEQQVGVAIAGTGTTTLSYNLVYRMTPATRFLAAGFGNYVSVVSRSQDDVEVQLFDSNDNQISGTANMYVIGY